jgi:hypothetical protein
MAAVQHRGVIPVALQIFLSMMESTAARPEVIAGRHHNLILTIITQENQPASQDKQSVGATLITSARKPLKNMFIQCKALELLQESAM